MKNKNIIFITILLNIVFFNFNSIAMLSDPYYDKGRDYAEGRDRSGKLCLSFTSILDDILADGIRNFDQRKKLSNVLEEAEKRNKTDPVSVLQIHGEIIDDSLSCFAKKRVGLDFLKHLEILDIEYGRITSQPFLQETPEAKNIQDYLKELLSKPSFKFLNIIGNYAASIETKLFFNQLTSYQLKKVIWVPQEWIKALNWVDIVCNDQRPEDVQRPEGPPLSEDKKMELAETLERSYNEHYELMKEISFTKTKAKKIVPLIDDWTEFVTKLIDPTKTSLKLKILVKKIDELDKKKELGRMLFEGSPDIKRNPSLAEEVFYTLLKKENDPEGFVEYSLARIYEAEKEEERLPEDDPIFLYKKSAEKGYLPAQRELESREI